MRITLMTVLLIQPVWTIEIDFSEYNVNTTRLDLCNQKVTNIKNTNALIYLNILDLSNNELTTLPSSIRQLVNLQSLYLSNNKLTKILPNIGHLSNIKEIWIDHNKLKEIPSEIGYLENLEFIYLHYNELTTLRWEVLNSSNLKILDVGSNNNLAEIGNGKTTVGKYELKEVLGDRVVFGDTGDTTESKGEEISKDEVYKMLKSKPIYWNFGNLRAIRPSPIPKSEYTEEKLMEVWNNIYAKTWGEPDPEKVKEIIRGNGEILKAVYGSSIEDSIKKLSEENASEESKSIGKILAIVIKNRDQGVMDWNISKLEKKEDKEKFRKMWDESKDRFIVNNKKWVIEDFIHHIYNPEEEYPGYPIPEKYICQAKDLIGSILGILSKNKSNAVVQSIDRICVGLRYCPYRLMLEMNLMHQILTGSGPKYSLKNFIMSVIKHEKVRIIEYVMTTLLSLDGRTNVLMGIMSEKIGLEKMKQDVLDKWTGSILQKFYSLFTPKHIFEVLKEHINADCTMVAEAFNIVKISKKLSDKDKTKMCQYEGKDAENLSGDKQPEDIIRNPVGITDEFVKYYLIEMMIAMGESYSKRKGDDVNSVPSTKRIRLSEDDSNV